MLQFHLGASFCWRKTVQQNSTLTNLLCMPFPSQVVGRAAPSLFGQRMPDKMKVVRSTWQSKWGGLRLRKTNQRRKGRKDRGQPSSTCRLCGAVQPEPALAKPSLEADGLKRLKIVREFLSPHQEIIPGEAFLGSPDEDFKKGEDVVISFPGTYDAIWKEIGRNFVTTSVWMPQGTQGYGEHPVWSGGKCYCHHLYGTTNPWGCRWFEKWLEKLQLARDRGCNLIVVTKGDFALSHSQKGQLAWVRKERIPVRIMSNDEFAVEFFGRENGFEREARKILDLNDSNKIDFTGSGAFKGSQVVIVSFPGVHGHGWNQLTRGSSLGQHDMATSCIFLPNEDSPGYGDHCDMGFGRTGSYDFFHRDGCHCDHLYPFPEWRARPSWGCAWFEMWTKKTCEAHEGGCHLIVVTKQDGSLGNSQKGEVRFLNDHGMKYIEISISEFALMLLLPGKVTCKAGFSCSPAED